MSVPHAEIVELMKVSMVEGEGRDDDPMREVDYYYEKENGMLLWRRDEWEEAQASKPKEV